MFSILSDLIGCFFIAWFDILGRLCRTVACKEHTPSTVSLVSVLEIPFTYAWGWLWSGQAMGELEVGVITSEFFKQHLLHLNPCEIILVKSSRFYRHHPFLEIKQQKPNNQQNKIYSPPTLLGRFLVQYL